MTQGLRSVPGTFSAKNGCWLTALGCCSDNAIAKQGSHVVKLRKWRDMAIALREAVCGFAFVHEYRHRNFARSGKIAASALRWRIRARARVRGAGHAGHIARKGLGNGYSGKLNMPFRSHPDSVVEVDMTEHVLQKLGQIFQNSARGPQFRQISLRVGSECACQSRF